MPAAESLPLWEAVQVALKDAKRKYIRKVMHNGLSHEELMAELRELNVAVQLKPGLNQHLTFTFYHRVASRSFMYYYTLRQQADRTYRIIDVERMSQL